MEKTDITVALYDDACGLTPVMPYVGISFDGKYFTRLCKYYLGAALLRCGMDIVDCRPPRSHSLDASELAVIVNRRAVDACIVVSFAAFGSGKSFNDRHGFTVHAPSGRAARSTVFCEDICAKLNMRMCGDVEYDGAFSANTASAIVDAGYLTCFEEAKLVYDPDFAQNVAEGIALGVCEHFDIPYAAHDDASRYPLLGTARRGKKVKLLQCLLNVSGADVEVDGIYDDETDGEVKAFCKRQSKPTDRGVTADLWRDMLLTERRALSFGSTDSSVLYLQRKLLSKLYPIELSGVFDEKTLEAVNAFCRANNLAEIDKTHCVYKELYSKIAAVGGGKPRIY